MRMTPKELKRLSRSDLLEMLLEISKENERLQKENDQLREQLADRDIRIQNCGSLAEAALQLNGIFQAAQSACEQYAQNVKACNDQLEQETREKCEAIVNQTKERAAAYLENAKHKQRQQEDPHAWVSELKDIGEEE
jgi:cell division septum initiation protein DivIVA